MIGAAIGSTLIGAVGARSAARAQGRAANSQLQLGREQMAQNQAQYDTQVQRFNPYYQAGTNALAAYQSELGLGSRPEGYTGISMSPGAQFALEQGRDTMEAGAAMRGGLNSGAALAGLERLRMGMAAQDRDSQLNRLAGMTDMGMGAAGMQAQAGNALSANNANSTQFMGNALANRGNAAASGAVGMANALQGGLNNAIGIYGYQQQMGGGGGGLNVPANSAMGRAIFGGGSWTQ